METILPHVIELKDDDRELDLTAIVPEGMPLEIEIGCGNGRFLAARATKNPTIAYIGIERMMERIRRCSKKAHRDDLINLTFLRVEAGRFVRDLLPNGRVQAMYLFFPDPWPKRRHHKHRFFQREMCDTLARVFIPGGCMYISTDHEDYFKEMYRYLSEDIRFTEVEPLLREADEQTDFERLFLSKGDAIYNCAFRLNS